MKLYRIIHNAFFAIKTAWKVESCIYYIKRTGRLSYEEAEDIYNHIYSTISDCGYPGSLYENPVCVLQDYEIPVKYWSAFDIPEGVNHD